MTEPTRRLCVSCVRKHLAHASVLLGEASTPEYMGTHLWLAIAHLGEAVSECPSAEIRDRIEGIRREYVTFGTEYVGGTWYYDIMKMIDLVEAGDLV